MQSETGYNRPDLNTTSNFIIFAASGLLAYWTYRVRTILHADSDEIDEALDFDIRRVRTLLLAIRSMFYSPTQFC